jgi:HJR/Mrr/RecB family endonuclease
VNPLPSTSPDSVATSTHCSADEIRAATEQVTESRRQWQLRRAEYRQLAWKRRAAIARASARRVQLFFATRVQRIHNVIRRDSRTASDKMLVSVAFGLFTGIILLSIYLFCMRIMSSAGLLLGLVTVLGALYAVFFVSDRSVQASIDTCRTDLDKLRRFLGDSVAELQQAKSALLDAYKKYDSLRREYRRIEQLAAQPPVKREVPFEAFLKDVFIALGYRAVVTKNSGDRQIDLVIERRGVRTAVQAKENVETIGKNAIQQIQVAMKSHACDRCAIITNGTFTPPAIELAKTVGCILIQGSQIADLVAGKIEFD